MDSTIPNQIEHVGCGAMRGRVVTLAFVVAHQRHAQGSATDMPIYDVVDGSCVVKVQALVTIRFLVVDERSCRPAHSSLPRCSLNLGQHATVSRRAASCWRDQQRRCVSTAPSLDPERRRQTVLRLPYEIDRNRCVLASSGHTAVVTLLSVASATGLSNSNPEPSTKYVSPALPPSDVCSTVFPAMKLR